MVCATLYNTTKNDENYTIILSDYSADCDFAIIPKRIPLNCQTVLTIDHQNQTTFVTVEDSNFTLVDALVVVANTSSCQLARNDPACSISSLEVYRGREEAIEISHEGFSLSDKGTIEVKNLTVIHLLHVYISRVANTMQVNSTLLAYSIEDLKGELYRMTLSCPGGKLLESGCLFFKVAGVANITNG